MNGAREAIRDALDRVRTVDPHCHLRPDRPTADTLADIVLYHHVWIELVSAGMDVREVTTAGLPHETADPGMPPLERVRRALPYLAHVRTTTVGAMLRWILEDLYGLDGPLSASNLDAAARAVGDRARDAAWRDELLRERCGIAHSVTVEKGNAPPLDAISRGKEWAPFNLASGKLTPREVLDGWAKEFGREITSAADYVEFIASSVAALPEDELKFVGFWLPPQLTERGATEGEANRIIRAVRDGAVPSDDEIGRFAYCGVTTALSRMRSTKLRTIQLITGAEVLPPHRSIAQWSGAFPGALARIAGAFGDFEFNVSSAADAFTQDIGVVAKHVPNVSVAGYWWHTLYPFYIRKSVETRIDMIPANKIVAFFSDAYHAEWCYPKLRLVKRIWEDVLVERVESGFMDVDAAADLVRAAFYENPKRIYGIG